MITAKRALRRRGTDHIGFLNSTLRNLLGYATLANELIQNADDASNASAMAFDVRQEALVVDNDGTFTDCGQIDSEEWRYDCPWKREATRGKMCDFHRFQNVASGDKRDEFDTTGAFGIGFTAVYQITDRPELISAGRHWLLFEERPEDERIEECLGCAQCKTAGLANTRFILPWATDADSQLRKKLDVEPVTGETQERILEELLQSVPLAMLFLRKLSKISVLRDGQVLRTYERSRGGDDVIVSDGQNRRVWHVLHADFAGVATALRAKHPRIEAKRSSAVAVAIPAEQPGDGVLCASLPTRQRTGLPFHINADFFPKSDRKEIIFDDDYKAEWNRAAITAAAEAFGDKLHWLRDRVGPVPFWKMMEAVRLVGDKAESIDTERSFGDFWGNVQTHLRHLPVVFTSGEQWVTPNEALFLESDDGPEIVGILESLHLRLVHPCIRFAQNLLRSGAVGVPLLTGDDLARALCEAGLSKPVAHADLPPALRSDEAISKLWKEIDRLIKQKERLEPAGLEPMLASLRKCAVAPTGENGFLPCGNVFLADEQTPQLFSVFSEHLAFLPRRHAGVAAFQRLCPLFGVDEAISHLEHLPQGAIQESATCRKLDLAKLIRWFEERQSSIIGSKDLTSRLSALPIFPSAKGPRALTELSLPGFHDPLGLADIVSSDALAGRTQFLRDLGATELTFNTYAREYVPRALEGSHLSREQRRAVVRLLADELGQIRDDEAARLELLAVPVVECQDGEYRRACDAYLPTGVVAEVLSGRAFVARIPSQHATAIEELYRWLGVADEPRLPDVIDRISTLTAAPPTDEAITAVRMLFGHLGTRLVGPEAEAELACLKTRAWLPVRGDRGTWRLPQELYADFTSYLFESQASFLDIPQRMLQANTSFLDFLGVATVPTIKQVVSHLLHCSEAHEEVNRAVYRWLEDRCDKPGIEILSDKHCLLMPDGTYVRPQDVFWQAHSFGRFRRQLGEKFRDYHGLLKRLGVHESPGHENALEVIRDIADEFGRSNRPLDSEAHSVLMHCWRVLGEALEAQRIERDWLAALSQEKVVCAPNGVLQRPVFLYFDDRPGLAAKFGPFFENSAVKRPPGGWTAMEAAGVRPLSGAVESHLAETINPVDDDEAMRTISERRHQLARVLEFQRAGSSADLKKLTQIRWVVVDELVIIYTARAFNREQHSSPEAVQAHYLRDESALYFARTEGRTPWTAVARELAGFLRPDEEPGGLASLLKDILGATSPRAADETLDQLDIPRLDTDIVDAHVSTEVVDDLGGAADLPQMDQVGPGPDTTSGPLPNTGPQNVDDAVFNLLGGALPPTTLPTKLNQGDRPAGWSPQSHAGSNGSTEPRTAEQGSQGGSAGGNSNSPAPSGEPATRHGYSILYSYVMPERPGSGSRNDDGNHAHRTAVDQAGVDRVMRFERDCGRRPHEKPPKHPGYDVESFNGEGVTERVIEVKSLSGDWNWVDVRLTSTQFNEAKILGEKYWLYVVERAEEKDSTIYCIQNPAEKANRFLFDPGWKALAEVNAATERNDVEPAGELTT